MTPDSWWRGVKVIGVLALLATSLGGTDQFGPDLRAAHGHGTHGTWVAEQHICGKGDCFWRGDFFLPDGTEARQSVTYLGNLTSVHHGLRVPALDTGGDGSVYPVTGGAGLWVRDIFMMAGGGAGFILLGGGWFYLWLRRIRRLLDWDGIWAALGISGIVGRFGFLDAAGEAAERYEGGDHHDDGHAEEHVPGGVGEVGADERRDGDDVAAAALKPRLPDMGIPRNTGGILVRSRLAR